MIRLEAHPLGTILSVRARPGARRNAVEGCHDGALKVSVTQAPEKGKANKAIIALLSKTLGLRKSQFELLSGETSPRKRFLVRDATPEQIQQQVDAVEGV
ncbi:MAG: DUF167 domain-containing protein [Planctomycetes bacterium]|nr:DUF167 domain-containing protein [Planctomycetota bacterium]